MSDSAGTKRKKPATDAGPVMGVLAELTHRCPLQCPYCSNPLELSRRSDELSTEEWISALKQAAGLGALQVHLSGGEPTARKDLTQIIAACRDAGLYSNLITSGVLLSEATLKEYREAGLDHVQVSVQDAMANSADVIANYPGGHYKKLTACKLVRKMGLPLTLNAVVHRHNLDNLQALIDMALQLDAHRLEIANVQYYGWALRNRAVLMPTGEQVERSVETVESARQKHRGRLVIDFVVPDYFARRPKRCMNGWGREYLAITPRGLVLPCHAAETITNLRFSSVRDHDLAWIWEHDPAINRFRGTDWMPEPCRSCQFKERDLGGCRCQAFALTGSAADTDPVCELSPEHGRILEAAGANDLSADYIYRR
ncbi:MAG: pyrroloquinoline quinone biosynthesis protein PqqE [Kiloniellales bacterium]|nr:pyrroloquinoline quinone biosynthesis protein PqqE [Kiloniellales bacterium]